MAISFDTEFFRLRRALARGRRQVWGWRLAGWVLGTWLAWGVLDLVLGFPAGWRGAISMALAVLLLLAAARRWRRECAPDAKETATAVDAVLPGGRAVIRGALGLAPAKEGTSLADWLAGHSRARAAVALHGIGDRQLFPVREGKWCRFRLLVLAGVTVLAAVFFPRPFGVEVERLLRPFADLPPWSPLVFQVTPATPTALYGGELEVAVTISGGEVMRPVVCLVREKRGGTVAELSAFREKEQRFSRRLENINEPLEIAFACGRARSEWVSVEILYQPQILSGKIKVTPPAYTGLPSLESNLDATELRVPEGAAVELRLTSNRPLSGGVARFTVQPRPGEPSREEELAAEISGTHEGIFRWTAARNGHFSAILLDVRGTPSPKPLQLGLRVIPDMAPEVTWENPPPLLLATPSVKVPLRGEARDEYALENVRLVRAVAGMRDRSLLVADQVGEKRFSFADKLDLGRLGVVPGETLELLLEASDYNPSLMGQGSSDVARIVIISEEEYAERLRAEARLEEFLPRFAALFDNMTKARQALGDLEKALDSGDAEQAKKAREEALAAQRQARENLEKLAEDFPAFALEERLQKLARENAALLSQNEAALATAQTPAQMAQAAKAAKERLGQGREEEKQLEEDAQLAAEAGRILEMAAQLQKIYLDQKSLEKRFETIAREVAEGVTQNRRQLPLLAETQRRNETALREFSEELVRRLRELPVDRPELDQLRADAGDFVIALNESDPGSVMAEAAAQADLADSFAAYRQAGKARGILERLLKTPGNGFCEACGNNAPRLTVVRPDVNRTLEQMLAGMCANNGESEGTNPGSGGFGMGGTSSSGFAMAGTTALRNVPVQGPSRGRFSPASMGGEAKGSGRGAAGAKPAPETAETGRWKTEEEKSLETPAPDSERVPESYREAVKRYFSE